MVSKGSDGLGEFVTRVRPKPDEGSTGKTRRAPSRSTASERQLAELGETLDEKLTVVFGLASGIAPVTSTYAVENSEIAIRALLDIAKRRPGVLKALTRIADGADSLEIAKFVLGVIVCIQVDAGRLRGDELPARAFGVTDILEKHFNPDGEQQQKPNPFVVKADQGVRFDPLA